MNDWFSWNGVRCTQYGIRVTGFPNITLPAERSTFTSIPGRSGNLVTLEDEDIYDDVLLTCTCCATSMTYLDAIAAYLKGSGTVTFANRPGGFYYARIVNQIPFSRIVRGNPQHEFTVVFHCKPFFYLTPGADITLTESGTFLTNHGCIASEPVITIPGTGDITLMVGQQIIELENITTGIVLDSELQEAYLGDTSLNNLMTGDFPKLPTGAFAVSWTGNVSGVVIRPNWRTL